MSRPATPPVPIRLDLRPRTGNALQFPHRDWLAAYQRAVRAAGRADLARPTVGGTAGLRAELASYLGRTAGVRADPAVTVVTAGLSSALRLLGAVLRPLGVDAVAVEDPGDPAHRQSLAAAGLTIRPSSVDRHGADPAAVAASGARAALVTPMHQLPTAVTMSDERRQRLVRWAQESGGWVIELDHDGDLWLGSRRRPLALQRVDPQRVVYLGAADGTLGPGLRLAWMCVPHALLPPVLRLVAEWDMTADNLTQLAFADFLAAGLLDRHARRLRERWRARRAALVQAVYRHLPQARVTGAAAGSYAYLALPSYLDEVELIAAARRRSVSLLGGRHFAAETAPRAPALVVGYAGLPRSALFEAMRIIAEAAGEQATPLARSA